jgi:hypothetical protein
MKGRVVVKARVRRDRAPASSSSIAGSSSPSMWQWSSEAEAVRSAISWLKTQQGPGTCQIGQFCPMVDPDRIAILGTRSADGRHRCGAATDLHVPEQERGLARAARRPQRARVPHSPPPPGGDVHDVPTTPSPPCTGDAHVDFVTVAGEVALWGPSVDTFLDTYLPEPGPALVGRLARHLRRRRHQGMYVIDSSLRRSCRRSRRRSAKTVTSSPTTNARADAFTGSLLDGPECIPDARRFVSRHRVPTRLTRGTGGADTVQSPAHVSPDRGRSPRSYPGAPGHPGSPPRLACHRGGRDLDAGAASEARPYRGRRGGSVFVAPTGARRANRCQAAGG